MKNINYFVLAILSIVSLDAFAQRGIDGTPTISAANTIVNEYTTLTADAAVGATTISVAASGLNANSRFGAGNSLAAGDLIMIIQMQGASSSSTFSAEFPAGSGEFYGFPNDKTWGVVTGYNNCGNYEFAEVKSVPGTTSIELVCGLTYGYTTLGRTQVIRVPRYAALTLSGAGTISGQAWAATGNTGGVVAIEVLGNVTINNAGGISANSLGFRGGSVTGDNNSGLGGGQVARNNNNEGSEKGEGIFGYQADYNVFGGRYCRGAAGNAGGGGDAHNAGGGGGANAGNPATPWDGEGNPDISTASWATAWNLESAGFSTHVSSGGGRGGYSFSDQNADALVVGPRPFQSSATNAWGGDYRTNNGGWGGRPLDYSTGKLFIGGGGGAGDRNNSSAGNGGRGGGLVYLMCYGTVSGTGSVTANGANGGGSGADGAGGGGGGGTIVLNAVGVISGISASAIGGTGGSQTINNSTTSETEGPGGGGGGGYIAVSNGAIVQTVTGGMNGTTNANQLSEFPPNGATRGAAGLSNQTITNFTIAASDVTICSGNTATLTVTSSGTVPSPITYNWYTTPTGGNPVGTGASFTTPILGATTTYYVGTCPGTYRIPVVVTVTGSVPASVAVAASATTICTGQSVTFTATPTNGGTPTYQWQVNGGNVGTNSSTFTSTTLSNGDVVTVIMTSSLGCASGSPATSNSVTMTVNAAGAASVSVAASATTICFGNSVTFTATPTNGGATPSYQWQVNGSNVGTNSPTFTSTTLTNGQTVTVIMTSSSTCATGSPATSNSTVMTVNSSVVPSVSIVASATTICSGSSVTFTATPTNGGTPTYQWQVNGSNVGTNSSTFSSSTLNNGDAVTVIMTSSNACASPASATSNSVSMTVNPVVTPAVSIVASATAICTGASVTFTATPTNGGTTPSYQWQVNGSNVGTNATTFTSSGLNNGDIVTVILTSNAACASPTTATSNSVTMTVNTTLVPSVSIAASATTICAGASVTFTATPTNGGSSPSYQWQVNGGNVGTNSTTFTTTTLNNGDVVTVILTSSDACAAPATATSNSITMSVGATVAPSVSIAASSTTICSGTSVTFTATPTNGGTTPAYQWQVNGTNVGTNSDTFTSTTLANGDVVTVILTSNLSCASPATATSNSINITVNSSVTPSVSIVASSTTICSGTSVTFTATPTNGGAAPSYQWQVNGSNVGTNSATFTSTTLTNGDVVTVIMTSNAACASPATATSNAVTMTVTSSVTPSVSIVSTGTTICAGDAVTFTATPTNGGTTPSYQWQVNGSNAGTNSTTFTSSTLANGDVVTVIMTSSDACASPATATSNAITITVQSSVVPSVSIVSSGSTICAGDAVTFTATPTNGGATPGYQWQVNGTNAGTNSDTFTSSTLANGDVVTVIMTSSSGCASPGTATSNAITITVQSSVAASVSIAASTTTICSGDPVTFTATPTNGGATPGYQWQVNGTNAGTNSDTFTSSTLASGDVVTVIMTSSSSCATGSPATSNAVTVTVQTSVVPSVSISPAAAVICTGDAATFTATPTNGGTTPTYQWQVNGTNAGTNSATFTSSTLNNGDVVTVIMTSNSSCASPTTATSNSATVTVNTCSQPTANFTANQTILCQPGCVNFTDLSTGSPTSWSWSFPGASPSSSTAQNPTNICYSANGSYTVTLIATNADGSDTLTQTGYITVGAPVQVTISGNTSINACEQTYLSASPADGTYSWGPNVNILCETCVSALVSPAQTQDYYVTYTSPDGCTDSDTVTVTVTNIYTYFMPTGFSPNGDGVNDELLVRGRGVDYINLKIFDRIGEKVFETNDIDKGWDGKLLGLPMNDNVFVYMLEVTFCNGDVVKEKGNVTLVK